MLDAALQNWKPQRVSLAGEVKGLSVPLMKITVFNGAQGWNHEGHVNAEEARALAGELLKWADDVDGFR